MQFVSVLNVHRMVEQLRMGTIKPISWISEGKAVHEGTVKLVEVKASKGIKIILDSGKVVWWRCSKGIAMDVLDRYDYPVCVPFIHLEYLSLIAAYKQCDRYSEITSCYSDRSTIAFI